MIPKTIHYCWFGRNPKPKLAEKCIKSWKKFCKNYKFIEWNEDNFDISKAPLYVQQAYESKKWAFVTDYVRLYAMVNYGGIYMDTDVEVVKPLDPYLEHKAFSGFENGECIPTGIMACEKEFPLFKELLHYYEQKSFIKADGSLDMTDNVTIITGICEKKGLQKNGQLQIVEDFVLYPREVFCPSNPGDIDVKKYPATVTIHWFAGSWLDEKTKLEKIEWQKTQKENKRRRKIKAIKKLPKRIIRFVLGEGIYTKIRQTVLKK